MSLLAGKSTFEYIIPIKVNSPKAIYFIFSPSTYIGYENFCTSQEYSSFVGRVMTGTGAAVNGTTPANPYVDNRVMKKSWFHNNLTDQSFLMVSLPLLHLCMWEMVFLRTFLSILDIRVKLEMISIIGSWRDLPGWNFIFGQEFEIFSQQGPDCYLKIFCSVWHFPHHYLLVQELWEQRIS